MQKHVCTQSEALVNEVQVEKSVWRMSQLRSQLEQPTATLVLQQPALTPVQYCAEQLTSAQPGAEQFAKTQCCAATLNQRRIIPADRFSAATLL